MAEGLFLALTRSCPQCRDWQAASAGVAADKGSPASRETLDVLSRYGIDLSDHESQPVTEALVEEATDIFAMTQGHLAALLANFPEYAEKMHMMTDASNGRDVPDPIGCGKRAYEETAAVLEEAITSIIRQWKES